MSARVETGSPAPPASPRRPFSNVPADPRWRRSRGLQALVVAVLAGALILLAIESLGGAAGLHERVGDGAAFVLVPTSLVFAGIAQGVLSLP